MANDNSINKDEIRIHTSPTGSKMNVGIASIISSRSRMRLVDAILKVGFDNALYTDTDSIVISDYNKSLPISKELGD